MENKEKIFKIGIADTQWAQLTIFESGMHLLTLVDKSIKCTVNGNVVSKQYWVHEDDKIEIAGQVFDWNYIKGTSESAFKEAKQSPKGSGFLKLIVLALLLVAVAGAGYWFLKNQDSSNTESSQTSAEESVDDTADVAVEVHEFSHNTSEDVKVANDNKVAEEPVAAKTPAKSTEKPAEKSTVKVDENKDPALLSVDELWTLVNKDTKNSYALYYLAKHYHNRKLDSNATKFWNTVLSPEGDVARCLNEDIRKITSERFVFVMLARSYRNIPSDMEQSLRGDIVSLLNKIKNKYPDKYTY